jgi:hypothetical protein
MRLGSLLNFGAAENRRTPGAVLPLTGESSSFENGERNSDPGQKMIDDRALIPELPAREF